LTQQHERLRVNAGNPKAKISQPSKTTLLNWDDLRVTLVIAEYGTLSGAATHLRISHPTLSRRLRQIERRLGTRLFERTPSGLQIHTEVIL
jgi:hypothetical protein